MSAIHDDRKQSLLSQLPSSTEIIEGRLYLGKWVVVSFLPPTFSGRSISILNIFIHSLASSLDLEYREKLGITHVVCVCSEGLQALTSLTDHQSIDNVKTGIDNEKFLYIPVEDDEYEDILTHLPRVCAFIEDSLRSLEVRVLVHCKMGVSRSVATVAAYLMKSRQMKSFDAVEHIRARRPHIHPNYGFLKQLEIFEQCNYTAPKPQDPVYRSWKRKYAQDVQSYLGYAGDIISIGAREAATGSEACTVYLTSDFPEDYQQSRHLLREFEVTHLVVIGNDSSQCEAKAAAKRLGLQIHEVTDLPCSEDGWGAVEAEVNNEWLETSVLGACRWLRQAIGERGSNDDHGNVLVFSPNEARACVVVCAYMMVSRKVNSEQALSLLQNCLPLFNCSQKFLRQLQALDSLSKDLSYQNNIAAPTGSLYLTMAASAAITSVQSSGFTESADMVETCNPPQSGSAHPTREASSNSTLTSETMKIQSTGLMVSA